MVKTWYQQGTAWYGGFQSDVLRRILTPELLLHDDSLVKVDHALKENHLRCDYGSSSAYRWMSFDPAGVNHSHEGQVDLKWIHDAPKLVPFALQKNAFKQLMFTFHGAKGLKGGTYRGAFKVSVGGEICELRLLSAREMLGLRRDIASGELDDAQQRALWANAELLSIALYRDDAPMFDGAEEVLSTLGVGEINALVERYAALDGAVNPSVEDGRGEIEALKKD